MLLVLHMCRLPFFAFLRQLDGVYFIPFCGEEQGSNWGGQQIPWGVREFCWARTVRGMSQDGDNFSTAERTVRTALLLTCSALSFLGCIMIISSIFILQKYRKTYWRQVGGLALIGLIHSLTMVTSSLFFFIWKLQVITTKAAALTQAPSLQELWLNSQDIHFGCIPSCAKCRVSKL